jgi:hypothetical protein
MGELKRCTADISSCLSWAITGIGGTKDTAAAHNLIEVGEF